MEHLFVFLVSSRPPEAFFYFEVALFSFCIFLDVNVVLYEILSSWGKTDFVLYVREIELSGDEETPLHIPQDTDVTIFFKFFDRRNRCLRFVYIL